MDQSLVHTFSPGKFVWTNDPESSSKVSPYTGIGPWMALPSNQPPPQGSQDYPDNPPLKDRSETPPPPATLRNTAPLSCSLSESETPPPHIRVKQVRFGKLAFLQQRRAFFEPKKRDFRPFRVTFAVNNLVHFGATDGLLALLVR